MAPTESKRAAATLLLSTVLCCALTCRGSAADPPNGSQPKSPPANKSAPIPADQFDKLRALIKPKPGGYDDIPWMTDLWEARKKAAAEGKPLFVWVGDGHPLGWT